MTFTILMAFFEDVLLMVSSIMLLPFITFLNIIFWVYSRIIYGILLLSSNHKISRMVGKDSVWCTHAEKCKPYLHIVFTMKGISDVEELKRIFTERIFLQKTPSGECMFPKFKQTIFRKWGYCFWKDNINFDMDNHISSVNLIELYPDLKDATSEERLSRYLYDTHQTPIAKDDSHVWEIKHVVTNENEYIHLWKLHHSFSDGFSLLRMFLGFYTDEPQQVKKISNPYTYFQRILLNLRSVFFFSHAIVTMLEKLHKEYRNPLHTCKTEFTGKKVCLGSTVRMEILNKIRKSAGVSMHDILFSSVSSSVSKAFQKQSCKSKEIIVIYPNGFIDSEAPLKLENTFKFSLLNLPVRIKQSEKIESKELERLYFLKNSNRKQQSHPEMAAMQRLVDLFSDVLPQPLIRHVLNRIGVTSAISNVPGPEQKMKIAGKEVKSLRCWNLNAAPTQIAIVFSSYCEDMNIQITCEDLPSRNSKEITQALIDDIVQEINQLATHLDSGM